MKRTFPTYAVTAYVPLHRATAAYPALSIHSSKPRRLTQDLAGRHRSGLARIGWRGEETQRGALAVDRTVHDLTLSSAPHAPSGVAEQSGPEADKDGPKNPIDPRPGANHAPANTSMDAITSTRRAASGDGGNRLARRAPKKTSAFGFARFVANPSRYAAIPLRVRLA